MPPLHQPPHAHGYDTAQICLSGHFVNEMAVTHPASNKPFCRSCGQPTIIACRECQAAILGYYHSPGMVVFSTSIPKAPSYCHGCGKPYPWTQDAIDALGDLVTLIPGLPAAERDAALALVPALQSQTPKSELAVVRWKGIVTKAKGEIGDGIRKILISLATEGIRKAIGL